MTVKVFATPLARRQIDALRGAVRTCYERWLADLKFVGCAALDYRLTGQHLDHLCVRHLQGRWRAIVAFEAAGRAWIITLGEHLRDPELDVYAALYRLVGHAEPTGRRTKPPCCRSPGLPTEIGAAIDGIYRRSRRLASGHG